MGDILVIGLLIILTLSMFGLIKWASKVISEKKGE